MWGVLLGNRWGAAILIALVFGIAFLLFPRDAGLLVGVHSWTRGHFEIAQTVAQFVSKWGDYPTYNLPLAILLWLIGAWRKNRALRRVAVICFLGATFAGIADDLLRLSLGRARPDAHLPDRFYGLPAAWSARFQSFPSGHAAAVFGTAVSLLMADLPLGIVTTVYALMVIWSRMELSRHYPSDIVVGSLIGIAFGLLVGFGARVRRTSGPRGTRLFTR